ncbi:MAG: response regulator [Anaerolineae bacterium]
MSHKILIVDDEPAALKVLGLALHREGYEVLGAQSGQEALQKARNEQPDLIILDVMMPDMDGFETCRQIRSTPDIAHIPVILLTALSKIEDKVTGFEAGADDYVSKPVSLKELSARVRVLLTRARAAVQVAPPPARAHIVAFVGVKGGVGTTTLALNVALATLEKEHSTILAELQPQGGSLGDQLGVQFQRTLSSLLEQRPETIDAAFIESCLLPDRTGLRVLLSPPRPVAIPQEWTTRHAEKIIHHLAGMADYLFLDLESAINPATQMVLNRANRIALVCEPDPIAFQIAKRWQTALEQRGLAGKRIGIVVVNRSNPATGYSRLQMDEMLGSALLGLIAPAPEICFYANSTAIPLLLHKRELVVETQIRTLAQELTQR